jgi:hypothetical protein
MELSYLFAYRHYSICKNFFQYAFLQSIFYPYLGAVVINATPHQLKLTAEQALEALKFSFSASLLYHKNNENPRLVCERKGCYN